MWKSWANVPIIIEKGADWYSQIGVPNSTGTKVFSLVGKVNNVGLVEVPMGIPLSESLKKSGAGSRAREHFKAVQTGGPSGGCIPYALKDVAVDFDSLTNAGSMMGSGGMIVMDRYRLCGRCSPLFSPFLEDESCGKCLPCRFGLKGMREFLERFQ